MPGVMRPRFNPEKDRDMISTLQHALKTVVLRSACLITSTVAMLAVPFVLMLPAVANAHEYYADGFMIIHPWARPTAPGVTDTPVYFHLQEVSKGDRLIRGFSPLAEQVELRAGEDLHAPALSGIAFQPGDTAAFGEGRPHVLLRGLKKPFEEGRSYLLMLEFEKAGQIVTTVSIGDD